MHDTSLEILLSLIVVIFNQGKQKKKYIEDKMGLSAHFVYQWMYKPVNNHVCECGTNKCMGMQLSKRERDLEDLV